MSLPAPRPDEDEGMRRVYFLVLVCHASVITALWVFGRVFSG
ncbi:MAG TPA: hypothetical protein VH458_23225 [Vicinamibacterales bacterium]